MAKTRRSHESRGHEGRGTVLRTASGEWLQSEDQLLNALVNLAKIRGWLVYHQRPGQARSGRWGTQLQGHKGFPDIVLVKDGRFLVAELKSPRGSTTKEQREWLAALEAAGVEVHVWRPRDWGEIEEVLG